jgi:hypothetical protein
MSGATTRVRGLALWQPQRRTLDLLGKVRAVLVDGTTLAEPLAWDGAEDLINNFIAHAEQFRLDRQDGQTVRLIFAVEAAGMLPQIQRIADPFGITVQSNGGFDSLTAKYHLAAKLGQLRCVEVLHIGDHDPSGVHLFSSMAEDVQAIAEDLGFDADIRFSRLAVTPAQIAEFNLPTAAAKPTDRRSFDGETVQCEAIPPNILSDIVRTAIKQRLDQDAYAKVLDAERDIRARLSPLLDALLDDLGDVS